jgi:hypothetical protein
VRIELTPVEPERSCGSCTLCCKVMAVPELAKPADQWCRHARKSAGCAIYETRPGICREFRCLWLQGLLPEECKPERAHAVVTTTTDNQNMVIHEDHGYVGVGRQQLRPVIDAFIADGTHYVVVVCGSRRFFIGNPALAPEIGQRP